MHTNNPWYSGLITEITSVSLTLFKVMIPALLVVKALDMIGATAWLALALGPLMQWVGLPESMGLVWATTMLTNIYAGMLVYASLASQESLSVAQVTVLGGMLLIAHGLPVEAAIAKQAGVNWWVTLVTRIGGSLLFAWLLSLIYQYGGWQNQPAQLSWQMDAVTDPGLWHWCVEQAKSLLFIQVIIIALLTLLRILKVIGVERLLAIMLRPLLRAMGIGASATTFAIVGVLLGLAFGGGLLVNEARKGHVSARDVFKSILLLNLLHSIIEDTLLILLLGADVMGVLVLRMVFAFAMVALASFVMARA